MALIIPIKNQTKQMKKVLALLTAFVFVGLVACGPSANDAEKQKAAEDSTANALLQQAQQAAADSTAKAAEAAAPAAADTTKK